MNQSAFFEALGWSLIDSLWQMGAIWFSYILLTENGSRYTAKVRHLLALTGVSAGTLLFFASITINGYSAFTHGKIFSFAYFIDQQVTPLLSASQGFHSIVPLLSYFYLPAILFLSTRMFFQVMVHRRGYKKDLIEADSELQGVIALMGERFSIKNAVIWLSGKVTSPLTLGFWKPVIILPMAVFSHLSCQQVEAVIAHELFHIKRNDYLINLFLTFFEIVLFFNPFAKLLTGIIKKERENSCDDLVIAAGFSVYEYSQALYILGRFRNQQEKFALAATGVRKEYLLQRIRRLMNRENPQPSFVKPVVAFFLCLLVAGFSSRTKPVPTVAKAAPQKIEVLPVVYYSYQKTVTVETNAAQKKDIPVPPAPAAPPPVQWYDRIPEAPMPEDLPEITYVTVPESVEFTMIDHTTPDERSDDDCESQQPYIPKSAFYFTEVDTTVGKTIISL